MDIRRRDFEPYGPKDRVVYEGLLIQGKSGDVLEIHESKQGESLSIHVRKKGPRSKVWFIDHTDPATPDCPSHAFDEEVD